MDGRCGHMSNRRTFPTNCTITCLTLTRVCAQARIYAHILPTCVGLLSERHFQCGKDRRGEKRIAGWDLQIEGLLPFASSSLVLGLQPPAGVSFEASQKAFVPFNKCTIQRGSGRLMVFFFRSLHCLSQQEGCGFYSHYSHYFPCGVCMFCLCPLQALLLPPPSPKTGLKMLTCTFKWS